MYDVTLRCNCTTIVAEEEQQVLQILQVCLWPLVSSTHGACAILLSVACPTLHFSTVSYKQLIKAQRIQWLGHVESMDETAILKRVLEGKL